MNHFKIMCSTPHIAGTVICYAPHHGNRYQPGGCKYIGRAGMASNNVVRPLAFPEDAIYRSDVISRARFDLLFASVAGKFEDIFPAAADNLEAMVVILWLTHAAFRHLTDAGHMSEGELLNKLDSEGIQYESCLDIRYDKGQLVYSYMSHREFFGEGVIERNALMDSFMVLPRKAIIELAIHMLDAKGIKHNLRMKASELNLEGNILVLKRI